MGSVVFVWFAPLSVDGCDRTEDLSTMSFISYSVMYQYSGGQFRVVSIQWHEKDLAGELIVGSIKLY